jgi:hypothetical protein
MEASSDIPESWQIIGIPITRPEDDRQVAVYEDPDAPENTCDIHVVNGYRGSVWSREEIGRFGDGDFQRGIGVVLGFLATASIADLEGAGRYPPLPEVI